MIRPVAGLLALVIAMLSSWVTTVSWAPTLWTNCVQAADEVTIRKGVPAFSLPATGSRTLTLPDDAPATVVCFLGTECPLARLYAPRLQKVADQYASRGVVLLGIDSNLQDTLAEVESFRKSNNLRFDIGMDYDQKVASALGAERTPEVVVLDRNHAIRYRGRIDDQYLPGVVKPQATVSELTDALDAVLAGEPVSVERTQAVGCLIGKPRQAKSDSNVTYTGQIAKIFNAHCVECHRSGEIAPFAMTDYEELRGWGDMIVEVINDGRMPPWHAAPSHARLRNTRSMPESDKQLVRDWVANGLPYGNRDELPPVPETKSQWHLPRQPDLEVRMRETPYEVPAEGTVEYQYFVVDPQLKEDRWISAAQVIPGNPGVVHHAIVFIRPPDDVEVRGVSWLTAYVPGQRHNPLPEGSARRIPAGSKLVFQMHYTPNGQPQTDITRVGMLFVDPETVTNEVTTLMAINQGFEIPPNVANFPVTGRLTRFPKDGKLLAVSPHMHVRGKAFELFTDRNNEKQILVDVPRYDFNWQHTYVLDEPIDLSTIDALEFIARYDNSTGNPVNPNPNTVVTWGDQTWEEMAVAFFEVSQPYHKDAKKTRSSENRMSRNSKPVKEMTTDSAEKFADDFIGKLDRNHDGLVSYDEAPLSIQRYSFRRFDTNDDRRIDRQEVINAKIAK